jgi:radical SAM superfamily enzyme YgiQ (UPF0313 family)
MASLPGIAELCEVVTERGGRPSPSSLKADVITQRLARALGRSANHSVTIAPEAGSERMRRVINKNLTEPEILRAADWLVGAGVQAMKLYFMIGLPTETHDDVAAIAALTARIRERFQSAGRVQRLTLSVNPFAPKPWTPLQWEGMEDMRSLKRKLEFLRRELAHLRNVTLDWESPREAYYATLLSRGDRRVARLLVAVHEAGGDWWRVVQESRRAARHGGNGRNAVGGNGKPDGGRLTIDPDFYVSRAYAYDEILPWDFIDHSLHKRFLWVERARAYEERQTAPCDVTICKVCGAC